MIRNRIGIQTFQIRAFQSSTSTFNATSKFQYITDFQTLASRIDKEILSSSTTESASPVSNKTIVDSIRACRDLQHSIHNYDKFWDDPTNIKINKKISEILENENVDFNSAVLKEILLLQLPTTTNLSILQTYYKRHPQNYIDKDTGLIPLRASLFNGDLQNALKITDLTCGHPNYIAFKDKQLKRGVIQLFTSTVGLGILSNLGVKYGLEMQYIPEAWSSMSSVYVMLGAYILNSSFFAAVVKFGRAVVRGGGDYLTWQKGTFYTHWWKHADEMLMCSKILETDIALNSHGSGAASQGLIEELCRTDETLTNGRTLQPGFTRDGKKVRLLAPKDNINDLMLQAYWMTGGDGFEWVEPDQDPADLIWKHHLAKFDKPLVTQGTGSNLLAEESKSLKWADELIDPNSK